MYVWDQYVIGLDVAGYHMHFLPAFTATLFILLREDILKCRNVCATQPYTELVACQYQHIQNCLMQKMAISMEI